jgi:glutaminyl-tRNA synthetase
MSNFIENYWLENAGLWDGRMLTRFPPEPNGRLHIGHVKSICLNAGLALKFGGAFNLRMDDTNPEAEDASHARAIEEAVRWLGFEWAGEVKHASDHFDALYAAARDLTARGLAHMDFSPREAMREMRGSLTRPGRPSPDRERAPEWHLERLERMREGLYAEGECCLRAKIDMASANMNLRDPVLYRVKKAPHPRTGDAWSIYPSYDFAHPFCDAMEGISLSLCTLEFEDHRPFYEWVVEACAESFKGSGAAHAPVELEFARLELDRGLTSKRAVNALVAAGRVDGWDDPRLATLAGLRRRGFTASALRAFCEAAGVSKANSEIPFSRLEDFLRADLEPVAARRVVVARPIPLDIEGGAASEWGVAPNHPKDPAMGERPFHRSARWWVEADDVRLEGAAEPGFKRIKPGAVFRLMHGPALECVAVEAGADGKPARVIARFSEAKPKATVHALSREAAMPVEIWEPTTLADAEKDPASCLSILNGFCEPDALGLKETFHAPRYGYCVRDGLLPRLILSTRLRSGF